MEVNRDTAAVWNFYMVILVLMNLISTDILKNLCQITILLQNNEFENNVHFVLTDIIT